MAFVVQLLMYLSLADCVLSSQKDALAEHQTSHAEILLQ